MSRIPLLEVQEAVFGELKSDNDFEALNACVVDYLSHDDELPAVVLGKFEQLNPDGEPYTFNVTQEIDIVSLETSTREMQVSLDTVVTVLTRAPLQLTGHFSVGSAGFVEYVSTELGESPSGKVCRIGVLRISWIVTGEE